MNHFRLIAPLLILASPLTLVAQDAKKHKLNIDIPAQKGTKFEESIKATITMNQMLTVGGQPQQGEKKETRGEISGVSEILEVGPDNEPTIIKFTVKSFKVTKNGEDTAEPLPSGAVMMLKSKDGKESYTVNGEEADAETKELLDAMFDLSSGKKRSGDENKAFGTDVPRAVGEEWAVDANEMKATMPEDMPFNLDTAEITGSAKLVSVGEVDGTECATVKASILIKPKGMKGMPEQVKTSKVLVDAKMEGVFPLDGKTPAQLERMKMDFDFSGTITDPNSGTVALMKMKNTRDREALRKRVK